MQRRHRSGGHPERLVYERVLPAVPPAVGRLRHELDAALVALEVPRVRRHDVALVVTEAAANVVVHAYAETTPGLLYALACLAGPNLTIDIFDRGRGMVPNMQSPGLGVGLALMAQLADGLDIEPIGTGGLKVSVVFRGVSTVDPPAPPEPTRAERIDAYAETLGEDTPECRAEAEAAIAYAQQLRAERLG
jgi:anti-sigma regulatory factor (Ser/Thr protein kinase)